jgi:Lon protease-like protein
MSDFTHFPHRVPIFPLPLVFFPGQVKTLYIFEQRYKDLLQLCIRTGTPFGIVLAQPPSKTEPQPLPKRIGTLAHVFEVRRQPDDTFLIQIYGGERFKVTQFYHDATFLQASINSATLSHSATEATVKLSDKVNALLDRYLEALTQASGIEFQVADMPETAEQLAYLTANVLQINNEQKQELLEKTTLPELLAAEISYLHSEMDLMDWINQTIESPINNLFTGPGPVSTVSLN